MNSAKSAIDFSLLEKAIQSLRQALQSPPANDLERDGAIQRFEYTFELARKASKRVLGSAGVESLSPKSVIRDLGQQGWIQDAEIRMGFLTARNSTSHTYQEKVAQQVYETSKRFLPEAESLLKRLKAEAK